MPFKEFFTVPCLAVGHIDLPGLGVVDDVFFQCGDLLHPLFRRLDGVPQTIKLSDCPIRPRRQFVKAVYLVLLQKAHDLCHLFQVKEGRPPLVSGSLPLVQLRLNINEKGEFLVVNLLAFPRRPLPAFPGNSIFQIVHRIAIAQRTEPGKTVLPPASDRWPLARFILAPGLLQERDQFFKVLWFSL